MTTAGPRTVLGMTLHNNARHLREAADSILGQRDRDFVLLMLDDASADETEMIAHEYEAQDARVRYRRHPYRRGMVGTWKHVAMWANEEFPDSPYFAWVSDHDRWDPGWLTQMTAALGNRDVVLAYPATLRIDESGALVEKEPRTFDTRGMTDRDARWRRFCHEGFGSGDMVYGLMRMEALRRAGYFRPVLNPDRLLIGELTLQGQIAQVPEPLWFRRQAAVASVRRQRATLFAGDVPAWFIWPASVQHGYLLWREYAPGAQAPPLTIERRRLLAMVARYELASAWRGFRKTGVSKSMGRGVDNLHWVKKVVKKGFHHTVYYTAVGTHRLSGKARRLGRRTVYEILMFTHRTGLRGRGGTRTP